MRRASGVAILAALLLVGCSNMPARDGELQLLRGYAGGLVSTVTGALGAGGDGAGPTPAVSDPAQVNALLEQLPPGPVIRIEVGGLGQSAFGIQAGTNPPYRTFATFTGQSVTFRDGVVTGTRGFAFDLMSSSVGRAPSLVTGTGRGENDRVYRYLTGGDDETDFPVTCEIAPEAGEQITLVSGQSFSTMRMRETCQTGPFTYNNFYWVTGGGRVVKSQQWISRRLGMLTVEHLREG